MIDQRLAIKDQQLRIQIKNRLGNLLTPKAVIVFLNRFSGSRYHRDHVVLDLGEAARYFKGGRSAV